MAIKVGNSSPAPEYLPVGQSMWAVISPLLLFKATVTKQGTATFVLEGTNDGGRTFTNIFTLTLDGSEVIGTVINSAKLSMTFEKVRFSKSTGTGEVLLEAKNYG